MENTIGVLKGRFQSLRGLRILIGKGTSATRDHARAVLWFHACVVLHNLLLRDGEPLKYRSQEVVDEQRDDDNSEELIYHVFDRPFASPEVKREYIKGRVLQYMDDE